MTTTTVQFTPDQAQHIMQQTALALQSNPKLVAALGGPNAVKCWSCRIGLNAAFGAAIAASIAAAAASGGASLLPEAGAIALVTGLSEATVIAIFQSIAAGGAAGGAAAVEGVIEGLCKAMKACS